MYGDVKQEEQNTTRSDAERNENIWQQVKH